jgi:hypothetical protein
LPDGDWARFGLSDDERRSLERYVASSSGSLVASQPNARDIRDDVSQEMWLACLKFLADPGSATRILRNRTAYLHSLMYRAGQNCINRLIPDAPYEGSSKNRSRMVSIEEVRG